MKRVCVSFFCWSEWNACTNASKPKTFNKCKVTIGFEFAYFSFSIFDWIKSWKKAVNKDRVKNSAGCLLLVFIYISINFTIFWLTNRSTSSFSSFALCVCFHSFISITISGGSQVNCCAELVILTKPIQHTQKGFLFCRIFFFLFFQ